MWYFERIEKKYDPRISRIDDEYRTKTFAKFLLLLQCWKVYFNHLVSILVLVIINKVKKEFHMTILFPIFFKSTFSHFSSRERLQFLYWEK